MIDTFLIPAKTVVTAKGDGTAVDVSGATNRVFLLSLNITGIVEQESLDVSIAIAQEAIAARLTDVKLPNSEERTALNNALRALEKLQQQKA